MLEPDQGHVTYDGRNFTEMDRQGRKAVRQEIGMLFQGSALFDSMTVEENVMFPLAHVQRRDGSGDARQGGLLSRTR